MNDKQFQRLLDKTVKSAIEHHELMAQVGQECIRRYGYHYSDIDCDYLIDAVNQGLGYATVAKVDEEFKDYIKQKNDKSAY